MSNLNRDNVVELTGKKSTKKEDKVSLQQRLDMFAIKLEDEFREQDRVIRHNAGVWYLYENGYWRRVSEGSQAWYDIELTIADVGTQMGFTPATQIQILRTHMQYYPGMAIPSKDLHVDESSYVVFKNGTLHVPTGTFIGTHSPEHWATRYIDVSYDEDASCHTWLRMLDNLTEGKPAAERDAIQNSLQEWCGIALLGINKSLPRGLRKALFLLGPPYSGKTTILEAIQTLLGTESFVNTKVSELGSQFSLHEFMGAQAWICEETDTKLNDHLDSTVDSARIKNLITGEPMSVQRKFKDSVSFSFHGPVAWAGNEAPRISDTTNALYDRVILLEFDKVFTKEEAQKVFGLKKPIDWLTEHGELPGIVNWALEGYRRAIKRGYYKTDAVVTDATQAWRAENDPIFAFVRDCTTYNPNVQNITSNVSWAAWAYARITHNRTMRLRQIQRAVRNSVTDTHPEVRPVRQYMEHGRPWVYVGLQLNDLGLKYLEQARRDSEIAHDTISCPNEPSTG